MSALFRASQATKLTARKAVQRGAGARQLYQPAQRAYKHSGLKNDKWSKIMFLFFFRCPILQSYFEM